MVRSKYTFEKREKEKNKQKKRMEKTAQRLMAKKAKTASDRGDAGTDGVVADPETGAEQAPENKGNQETA